MFSIVHKININPETQTKQFHIKFVCIAKVSKQVITNLRNSTLNLFSILQLSQPEVEILQYDNRQLFIDANKEEKKQANSLVIVFDETYAETSNPDTTQEKYPYYDVLVIQSNQFDLDKTIYHTGMSGFFPLQTTSKFSYWSYSINDNHENHGSQAKSNIEENLKERNLRSSKPGEIKAQFEKEQTLKQTQNRKTDLNITLSTPHAGLYEYTISTTYPHAQLSTCIINSFVERLKDTPHSPLHDQILDKVLMCLHLTTVTNKK